MPPSDPRRSASGDGLQDARSAARLHVIFSDIACIHHDTNVAAYVIRVRTIRTRCANTRFIRDARVAYASCITCDAHVAHAAGTDTDTSVTRTANVTHDTSAVRAGSIVCAATGTHDDVHNLGDDLRRESSSDDDVRMCRGVQTEPQVRTLGDSIRILPDSIFRSSGHEGPKLACRHVCRVQCLAREPHLVARSTTRRRLDHHRQVGQIGRAHV